ncbi:ATP-dependent RNA helicase HrpA [Pseudoteredinibacter isoporae]|uniref:RNA helicase n=1 Tax=Pseudoteredinibacter isoporae TaxID=570281 RepID=A0A7X0JV52_9GAMM|nr:ATP-dependent RNA helicase HrpA [Pseudoteredinibacter isoporae]MBB6522852.1 ATP-dependent helicase HrpA [Pseudoteredinibacter isoporae]NHO88378.1 ATP-dependent RNA helicase HrpA [Pseudoteredinibacter isoporae]NIB23291.1 ATP-dependent RNA helicase HrpA [Pseudoteredinibacter isoporae]
MSQSPSQNPELQSLFEQLPNTMGRDVHRLRRQLRDLQSRLGEGKAIDQGLEKLQKAVLASCELRQRRQDAVPTIEFPENLPIAEKRADIAKAIAEHQVVVIAGETGSGKTTQLPKICLELGRGVKGLIGHTQPRRIAARTVANRIAEELHTPLGDKVGYQVRFNDHSGPETYIKLMTDGILLAEIQHDRFLNKYDTLIIDEAHERSLNIDFLLGYIKTILPKRPDLKVIITSATIDVERFSKHFNEAPVIEVSGRTFPVEVLYRPMGEREVDDLDLNSAIIEAIEEIQAIERSGEKRGGDILVFMSGEREIREAALAIRKANIPHFDVLPLYARLSLAEQNKVFQNHKGRRIVLATNVAETSITVPGIRYVIDPGTARVSRYSYKTKVQRLPIEAVSQASANQRKGRCGRVSEGLCIRLYSEEDFLARPEFTDAEILRTNLAAVILQMLQMRIGDVRHFPFVDKPDSRLINDGFKLLQELQAIDGKGKLNPMGRQIAKLNVDPSLARMVLAAGNLDCLEEVLIIVSALSIQDPRERPAEKKQQSDEKHRRFADEHSDFISLINLWKYAEEQRQELSQNQWRKQCKKEFLSYLRLREWRDIHHQLRLAVKDLKLKSNGEQAASYENVHRALISGLLGRVGFHDEERTYLGARNRRFSIFPGSGQYKKRPKWLLAAELIETSQLFAHTVAKIEPEWVLAAAKHLVKRSHSEPHYAGRSGQVMAFEKVSLYGLVLVEKQRVNYSQIDPKLSRDIFIREALVEGKYPQNRKAQGQKAKFYQHNQRLIGELHELEAKSRRRDLLVDDEVIYDFYQQRIPASVVNLAGFEHWRKGIENEQPECLFLVRESIMRHSAEGITEAQFPDELNWEGMGFLLTYHFDPKAPDDGVSLHVPVGALHLVPEARLDWLVPGLLREKCIALVKNLPKAMRKHFVPVPNFVDKALMGMEPQNRPLSDVLGEQLKRHTAVEVPKDDWNSAALDAYYRLNIKVEDERGKLIEQGRDLLELRERYKGQVQERLADAGSSIERDSIQQWDFGELAKSCDLKRAGVSIRAYPALVDEGKETALRLQDNPVEAEVLSRKGILRLALLNMSSTVKYLHKNTLKQGKDIGLSVANMGSRDAVIDDLLLSALAELLPAELPRQEEAFNSWLNEAESQLTDKTNELAHLLERVLKALVDVKKTLKQHKSQLTMAYVTADINEQLGGLFYPGCLYLHGAERMGDYLRYLKAMSLRLEKAPLNVQRDRMHIAELQPLWQQHQERLEKLGTAMYGQDQQWQEYRWLFEELRISLFAQSLKTRVPVSAKRLNKLWLEVTQ